MEQHLMDARTRLVYRVVVWLSGLVGLTSVAYGIISSLVTTGGQGAIGTAFVNFNWPLPYFAAPVSYFSVASVAFFYAGLRLEAERISRWPQSVRNLLQMLGFIVAFASAYEVLYNFMLWGSLISIENLAASVTGINLAQSPGPDPWNLVFATKAFSALFVISGYSVYFLRKISQSEFI